MNVDEHRLVMGETVTRKSSCPRCFSGEHKPAKQKWVRAVAFDDAPPYTARVFYVCPCCNFTERKP